MVDLGTTGNWNVLDCRALGQRWGIESYYFVAVSLGTCLRCLKTVCHAREGDREKVVSNTRATPGLGQLVNSEVRLLDRVTGEAVSGSCEVVPGGIHSQQSLKQPGWLTLRSLWAKVRIWSRMWNDKFVFRRWGIKEAMTLDKSLITSCTSPNSRGWVIGTYFLWI